MIDENGSNADFDKPVVMFDGGDHASNGECGVEGGIGELERENRAEVEAGIAEVGEGMLW